ncbi:hypothetical protein I2486_21460 [Cellulophaga sp. E16_2]|uniref:hypothetical protein n=1 Tax=Cellulophaga sp. E16_2 TaxID=2789297 RepID=UPI001A9287D4|nr:hypothetical protein [Cellulophaga sp. E16_2]MBO0593976.1 hypothetical protein [Cellulophaga sp. E16_2]
MKLFIKSLLVAAGIFTVLACGQNNKISKNDIKNRPIEKLYKDLKPLNYNSMPQYYIESNQSGCFYEIWVNGILVLEHFENVGLMNNAIPINDDILKSGLQEITVKLFPLGEIDGINYPNLTKKTRFNLEVFKRDKTTPWEGLDYEIVTNYFAPTTSGEEAGPFAHPGVPTYEETFRFNAEVPYELNGWSNSQIIKGQKGIEKEILNFYEEYSKVIQNQDEEKWVEMVKNRELEYFNSIYYNDKKDEEFKERISSFINTFDNEYLEKVPLDNYSISFSKNGKIVTLKSLDNPGASAFSYIEKIDYNGKRVKSRNFPYLFLHKPKGSNKLEIIR